LESKSFGKRRDTLCGLARPAVEKMDHYAVFSVRNAEKRERAGELLNSSFTKASKRGCRGTNTAVTAWRLL